MEENINQDEQIEKTGQVILNHNARKDTIHLLTIIGEIEGHDNLSSAAKTTKYEHVLPEFVVF